MRLAICVAEAYNKPRKPRIQPFSNIEQQAIYGAWKRGLSMQAIANTYGCSRPTISSTIQRQHRAQGRLTRGVV